MFGTSDLIFPQAAEKSMRDMKDLVAVSNSINKLEIELGKSVPKSPAPVFEPAGMKTGNFGVDLIKDRETIKGLPDLNIIGDRGVNKDGSLKGNPTIGWGHKLTEDENSTHIYKIRDAEYRKKTGKTEFSINKITLEQAEQIFKEDKGVAERAVSRSVTTQLTQNQYDALVDLAFNMGAGSFMGSNLVVDINAGDYNGAYDEWINHSNRKTIGKDPATGKPIKVEDVVATRRRLGEIDLWNTP